MKKFAKLALVAATAVMAASAQAQSVAGPPLPATRTLIITLPNPIPDVTDQGKTISQMA